MTRRWLPAASIAALASVAASTGLGNGFAYDDLPIIARNAPLHDWHQLAHCFVESYWPLAQGGTLYRPLATALFTIEWTAGGGSALPFHVVNLLLYVAVCLGVLALARSMLPAGIALGTAAAFAVHPVHVEVFANCVGQSELIVAGAVCAAGALYLRRRAAGQLRRRDLATLAILFIVGLLAKEHAIVLPALLLAAELTVVADPAPARARARSLVPLGVLLAGIASAYLILRRSVLGGLVGENPAFAFRDAMWTTRSWTMLGVVPQWVRLLVWPAHLSAVYSPPGTAVRDSADIVAMVGLVVLTGGAVLAVAARRQLPVLSFGLAWFGIAILPVSNVVVRTGVLLAERTLFLPSVGAMLAAGALVPVVVNWLPRAGVARRAELAGAATGLTMLLVAGLARSMVRAPVWHDDSTLFRAATQEEPLSYAAHYGYAGLLFNAGQRGSGEREARRALSLYGGDPRVFIDLATEYARAGACAPAERLARRALDITSHLVSARVILAQCRLEARDYAGLRSVAADGLSDGVRPALFRKMLWTADSGAHASALAGP